MLLNFVLTSFSLLNDRSFEATVTGAVCRKVYAKLLLGYTFLRLNTKFATSLTDMLIRVMTRGMIAVNGWCAVVCCRVLSCAVVCCRKLKLHIRYAAEVYFKSLDNILIPY